MLNYLVSLDFSVAPGEFDITVSNGTPEKIAAQAENLNLAVVNEPPDTGLRHYRATLSVEATNSDGLSDHFIGLFSHLPDYQTISVDCADLGDAAAAKPVSLAERRQAASANPQGRPFKFSCHFKSAVPFETLQAGFNEHVAIGKLVANANQHQEYVAFVTLEAARADNLEDAVLELLYKAFDAETEESALNFHPITTRSV